jgi:hypothetical protein
MFRRLTILAATVVLAVAFGGAALAQEESLPDLVVDNSAGAVCIPQGGFFRTQQA